jgi:hypothetical protein
MLLPGMCCTAYADCAAAVLLHYRRLVPKVFTRSGDAGAALSIMSLLLDPQQCMFDCSSIQVFNPGAPFYMHGGSWDTDDLPLPPAHSKHGGENGTLAYLEGHQSAVTALSQLQKCS